MNKQKLIEKYEKEYETIFGFPVIRLNQILEDLKQLDEPQKVVVPQFVADWIEYCKSTNVNLQHALLVGDVYFYSYANQKDFSKLKEFLETENNQEKFARAWLDGYEIEPEKRYTVKVRANGEYLNWSVMNTFYFSKKDKTYFVKSKLENAGFGWVFDCKGIEVREVRNE